jgi:TonB family protein
VSRGLPFSILLHLLGLSLLAAFGTYVPQPPLEPRRILRVQLAKMPEAEPQVTQPAPEPETQPSIELPEPQAEAPQRRPEPEPQLPPKEVPEIVREEAKPAAEPDPEPEVAPPPPREDPPAEAAPESLPAAVPVAAGPALSGTDVDFPFAWYLNRVEGIVSGKWNPRQLGFREGSARRCVVHFMVGRRGDVSKVTLVESSGVDLFDREALRAVKASRLPPLPAKFTANQLGVTFIFTLQSGI